MKNEKKKKIFFLMQEPFLAYWPNYSEKKKKKKIFCIARRQLYRDLGP